MAQITLKGNVIHTAGELPAVGERAADAALVKSDLSEVRLSDYRGKRRVLNVFPSIDTSVCATSVRQFAERAANREGVVVLNVSVDLPFALKRFCAAEGLANAETLSAFRSDFADAYGLRITTGPLTGLCSRAIVVLDDEDRVVHAEQVSEIAREPDYEAALAAL